MAESGRCMKCRESRDIEEGVVVRTKRGGYMLKGKCGKCGTTICKIMSEGKALGLIESGEVEKRY